MASKLQEGISILYDMELNNYLMTKSINKLEYTISNLGYYKGMGNKPQKKEAYVDYEENLGLCVCIFIILGIILGIIWAFIEADGFIQTILACIFYFFVGGIAGAVVGAIIGWIFSRISKSKKQKVLNQEYNKDCEEYQKRKNRNEARIALENKEKAILIEQKNALIAKRNTSTRKLNQYYNIMGIDAKYRNIVPIGYMYEFMRLGIATKLEGANGLYYLVRQELRHDQLSASLDEISRKLDKIIDNQHEIYYELSDMNRKCDKIISSAKKSAEISAKNNQLLQDAVRNTSVAAYNSERTKQELQFQNFMLVYKN